MIDMLKRHAIHVLRQAGHAQAEVARLVGVGVLSIRRVDAEPEVTHLNEAKERERRAIGRPAKAEPFRPFVAEILAGEPDLLSVEILRRAKLKGYAGGKTALYDLISAVRPKTVRPLVRFEGLAGEFSQHDFGHVDVRFLDDASGHVRVRYLGDAGTGVHSCTRRWESARWLELAIPPDERAELVVQECV